MTSHCASATYPSQFSLCPILQMLYCVLVCSASQTWRLIFLRHTEGRHSCSLIPQSLPWTCPPGGRLRSGCTRGQPASRPQRRCPRYLGACGDRVGIRVRRCPRYPGACGDVACTNNQQIESSKHTRNNGTTAKPSVSLRDARCGARGRCQPDCTVSIKICLAKRIFSFTFSFNSVWPPKNTCHVRDQVGVQQGAIAEPRWYCGFPRPPWWRSLR